MTIRTLITTSALLTLTACATIVEGSTDHINLSTNPATNASCTLTNKVGSYTGATPSQVTVQKSRSDLNVSCADPRTGAQGTGTIVSEVEPWDFGNILLGGLIGLGIDWWTGAAYNYPDSAVVPVSVPNNGYYAPQAVPQPGYAVPTAPTYLAPQPMPQAIPVR